MLLIFSVSLLFVVKLLLFFSFLVLMLKIVNLLLLLLLLSQREIDYSVAQIVKTLKYLGLLNDTLIFFTSDNGSVHLQQSFTHPGMTSVFELSSIFLTPCFLLVLSTIFVCCKSTLRFLQKHLLYM